MLLFQFGPSGYFLKLYFPAIARGSFHLHSRYLVQILVHSHLDLVSLLVAIEATELVSEPVTQTNFEMMLK